MMMIMMMMIMMIMMLLTDLCLQVAELKQEAGKISNLELQRKVVRVFYYLCVVTLQVGQTTWLSLSFTNYQKLFATSNDNIALYFKWVDKE